MIVPRFIKFFNLFFELFLSVTEVQDQCISARCFLWEFERKLGLSQAFSLHGGKTLQPRAMPWVEMCKAFPEGIPTIVPYGANDGAALSIKPPMMAI